MDRRDFLRSIALAGAVATIRDNKAMTLMSQHFNGQSSTTPAETYDLVAVLGGEPTTMFQKAISELGGMKKFISKGQKVVVKPNIGWDKTPDLAANTNPDLIKEIIKQCYDAGASEVIVFDHTCDDWRKCYTNSGIEAAAKAAGAKVIPADLESYYNKVDLPKAQTLKTAKIHKAILESDVWINVPVLKNHGGAKMSIAMKNLMGIVWDRRYFHANNLQQCIADISTFSKRPVLNIVDAYRVMKDNGPRGRNEADVVLSKALFISQDIVAVDTAATNFFNQIREMPLDDIKYISMADKLNSGTMQLNKLKIKRIRI